MANKQEIEKAIKVLKDIQRWPLIHPDWAETAKLALTLLEQAGEKKHIPFSERIGYSSPEKEQSGDNIGRCKVCGNILQKEGCPVCHQAGEGEEKMYPCADCGKLRTKDEGGTTFSVVIS